MDRDMLCCCMASCNVVIPRKPFLWGSRQPFFGVLRNKSLSRYYSKTRHNWVEIKTPQVFLKHWPWTGICCVVVVARAKLQFHENPSNSSHFPAFCFGTLFRKRYPQLSKSNDVTSFQKNTVMDRYMLCDMTIGNQAIFLVFWKNVRLFTFVVYEKVTRSATGFRVIMQPALATTGLRVLEVNHFT